MSEHEGLKCVFTGSVLEANYLKSLLEENGIGAMVRNTMEKVLLQAGFQADRKMQGLYMSLKTMRKKQNV
jgi:hypothetical protein